MNEDNLLYFSTGNLKDSGGEEFRKGYPPGSFWMKLLSLIENPPQYLGERYDALYHLMTIADSSNLLSLRAALPSAYEVMILVERRKMDRAEATRILTPTLELLPFLLMRFKPLQDLLLEIATKQQAAIRVQVGTDEFISAQFSQDVRKDKPTHKIDLEGSISPDGSL